LNPSVPKPLDSLSLAMIGSGGTGAMSAGQMLLQAAAQAGLFGLMSRSYGPQIRGGEAAALLRLGSQPLECQDDHLNLLLAFDWGNYERFAEELPLGPDSLVLADPDRGPVPNAMQAIGARIEAIPFTALAREIRQGRANMIGLGLLTRMLSLGETTVQALVARGLKHKGEEAVNAARECLSRGAAQADALGTSFPLRQTGQDGERSARWLITGNEATGLGALRGGLRFCAAYPITPSTEIVEWLATELPRVGGQLIQAEDELATINMCLGASFGGTPAMTATSGPGLSLMAESIGLAVAAEIPLLVVNVMRGGPSTGIPTKSEQADLNLSIYGLHGDAPHLVVAPNGVEDCLQSTQWALGLSEALQTATILLSDQNLGQSQCVMAPPARLAFSERRRVAERPESKYQRYAPSEDGVAAMSLPGTVGGEYIAESLAHDRRGRPSSQASDHHEQLDRRRDKLLGHDYGDRWADVEGDGSLVILTWGSTTAAVREAQARARAEGIKTRLVSLRLLSPALPDRMDAALAGADKVLVVEQSHGAQFSHYLQAHYKLPGSLHRLHRPGPVNLRPGEILATIRELTT